MSNTVRVILDQIGTDALYAVSAREFSVDGDSVAFRFGSNYGLRRTMVVDYNRGRDTYTLTAIRTRRNGKREVTEQYDDVYFDMLPVLVRDINNDIF